MQMFENSSSFISIVSCIVHSDVFTLNSLKDRERKTHTKKLTIHCQHLGGFFFFFTNYKIEEAVMRKIIISV